MAPRTLYAPRLMSARYLILSTSLRAESRSRTLAQESLTRLQAAGVEVELVDLCDHALPLCDGGACYGDPAVSEFKQKIMDADGYLIATPIYNFDGNAALKNAIELTGRDVWTQKVVGFLAAAGGSGSYMSLSGITLSLMLDFRTFCLPRFVYVTGEDFGEDGELSNDDVRERLDEVTAELVRVTHALRGD
jgi:NAD(P)H-dependent FMN reductase